MNGLQIAITNVIGQSNLAGIAPPPPDKTKFILSEQGDHLITETGNLKMIPENEVIYVFTESGQQIITENNKKIVTEL
jgi:hypothetical protein